MAGIQRRMQGAVIRIMQRDNAVTGRLMEDGIADERPEPKGMNGVSDSGEDTEFRSRFGRSILRQDGGYYQLDFPMPHANLTRE